MIEVDHYSPSPIQTIYKKKKEHVCNCLINSNCVLIHPISTMWRGRDEFSRSGELENCVKDMQTLDF